MFVFIFKKLVYFNRKIISVQYCSGFAIPEIPSHIPPHLILWVVVFLNQNPRDIMKMKMIICTGVKCDLK